MNCLSDSNYMFVKIGVVYFTFEWMKNKNNNEMDKK